MQPIIEYADRGNRSVRISDYRPLRLHCLSTAKPPKLGEKNDGYSCGTAQVRTREPTAAD